MKKTSWMWLFCFCLCVFFFGVASFTYAEEEAAPIGQLFIDAHDKEDRKGMEAVIEKHKDGVPSEVQQILQYALSAEVGSEEERQYLLMISGKMAAIYQEKTGDGRLLDFVKANIQQVVGGGRKSYEAEFKKIKEELSQLGKGSWNIRVLKFDAAGKLKVEINLKEKEVGFSNRYVSFKDGKAAQVIVRKYLPDAKGRIDWISGGMGMKAVLLE